MIKNLETADTIVKLVLACATIVLYMSGLIAGPFAVALAMLASLVLTIYLAKQLFRRRKRWIR